MQGGPSWRSKQSNASNNLEQRHGAHAAGSTLSLWARENVEGHRRERRPGPPIPFETPWHEDQVVLTTGSATAELRKRQRSESKDGGRAVVGVDEKLVGLRQGAQDGVDVRSPRVNNILVHSPEAKTFGACEEASTCSRKIITA